MLTKCIKIVKSGIDWFDESGVQIHIIPENFHLADGQYWLSYKRSSIYGDKEFFEVERLVKAEE